MCDVHHRWWVRARIRVTIELRGGRSRGRSGNRWKANLKVLGCEDAKWMKWLRIGTNVFYVRVNGAWRSLIAADAL